MNERKNEKKNLNIQLFDSRTLFWISKESYSNSRTVNTVYNGSWSVRCFVPACVAEVWMTLAHTLNRL